jgi:hypothetical protein
MVQMSAIVPPDACQWPAVCCRPVREGSVRYIVAWILGVPFSVIVVWYLLGHAACG